MNKNLVNALERPCVQKYEGVDPSGTGQDTILKLTLRRKQN